METLIYSYNATMSVALTNGTNSTVLFAHLISTLTSGGVECEEKLWWVFLLSGALIPLALLCILGIWRTIVRTRRSRRVTDQEGYSAVNCIESSSQVSSEDCDIKNDKAVYGEVPRADVVQEMRSREHQWDNVGLAQQEKQAEDEFRWASIMQQAAVEIASAQNLTGKVAFCITFVVSMGTLSLYFLEVSSSRATADNYHEICAEWWSRPIWQLEFACSIFLLVDLLIQFIAANDKLRFMFSVYAIVDYFTIPPVFLEAFLNHHWTGLRFLRALYILSVPDMLQFTHVLRTPGRIRLAQLIALLTSVILVGAGFYQLFEAYGDPHLDFSNAVHRPYWEYVYFVVVTMSTLGYGDISPVTRLARAFTVVYLLFAFSIFAVHVPEIFELVQLQYGQRYKDRYKKVYGQRHVVVAGDMSTPSMEWFLSSFNNPQRETKTNIHVVFVNKMEPDLEMEALIKRNIRKVTYIKGSMLTKRDLVLADVTNASAVLFLADRNINPATQDANNVMSVISVKNYSPLTRCLVEVLQSRNVTHVANIPCFNASNGDSVICFSSLKLGLLAQSCLAPGFSTLISNLMGTAGTLNHTEQNEVMADYVRGTRMKIVMEKLGLYFDEMTFLQTVKVCMSRLNLLLIGVLEFDEDRPTGKVLLNPRITVSFGQIGIFIARSRSEAARAWFLCKSCHTDSVKAEQVRPCCCSKQRLEVHENASYEALKRSRSFSTTSDRKTYGRNRSLPKDWEKMFVQLMMRKQSLATSSLTKPDSPNALGDIESRRESRFFPYEEEDSSTIDTPGDTAKTEPRSRRVSFSRAISNISNNSLDVSLAFYACASRPFKSVLLNRSKAARQTFTDHIIVLILANANDPPLGLLDFILPLRSTKLDHADLKHIVLLGNPAFLEKEWFKIHNLPMITLVKGDPLDRADLRAVSIKTCAMCVVLPSTSGGPPDSVLDDKDTILATLNIMAMDFECIDVAKPRSRASATVDLSVLKRAAGRGFDVPTITPLYQDNNVPLLEAYISQKTNHHDIFVMEPYVCGYALPLSALDSILIATFFNPYTLDLIKAFLFGDMSVLTETLLREGIGLVSSELPATEFLRSTNAQLRLISLLEPPFSTCLSELATYGELVTEACDLGMVCLGVARLMYPDTDSSSKDDKRCVITNPPPSYVLRIDDLVYVLSS